MCSVYDKYAHIYIYVYLMSEKCNFHVKKRRCHKVFVTQKHFLSIKKVPLLIMEELAANIVVKKGILAIPKSARVLRYFHIFN